MGRVMWAMRFIATLAVEIRRGWLARGWWSPQRCATCVPRRRRRPGCWSRRRRGCGAAI